MNRPDDIPQGIWDAAEAAGEAMHGRHERGWVAWPLIPAHGTASHQEIVARAILAERLASATRLEAIAEELDSQPAWALYREAAQAVRNGTMPDDPLGIKASEQLVPHPVTGAPTDPQLRDGPDLIDRTLEMDAPELLEPADTLFNALSQVLDDMGRDGTSCCVAAKFQALDALRVAAGKPRTFEQYYRQ